MQAPRATYRLQFHARFRLRDAISLVPYFESLGISHIYASPLFKATPCSTHGYDVCDFSLINDEIGTEADLEELAGELHQRQMGLILDIVPNHMGIGLVENKWWWDVLKNGQGSSFADCFDINWNPPDARLKGKILVPILGDQYEKILERGELQIGTPNGEHVLCYFKHQLPLATGSIPQNSSAGITSAELDRIIKKQHYVLADYRQGDRLLNYRRFFAINTLAGLRVEDEKIFDAMHGLLSRWAANGWIDGVRVDHPDGLRDPEGYLKRLRACVGDKWIVVEKILERGEGLPKSWPVQGTTGYDFLGQVNGVFVDSRNEEAFTKFYKEFTDEPVDFEQLVRDKKLLVLRTLFRSEIDRLVGLLLEIVPRLDSTQQHSQGEITEAVTTLAVCFSVYRTYASPADKHLSAQDESRIKAAIVVAYQQSPKLNPALIAALGRILLLTSNGPQAAEFVARFQQLTGPAMAKGVEDTAFYCYNRFTSLNEVGGDPGHFGVSVEDFHNFCTGQQLNWPDGLLASSTHDTKRGEDVRARLNVLSEIPDQWFAVVRRWAAHNERLRRDNFPDRNAEYLFYQSLVGAWPISVERMQAYMEKAVREAKQHTQWETPDAAYEKALKEFIAGSMNDAGFIGQVEAFVVSLNTAGIINSLSQTLLKLTAPGVPDIYQGCELHHFTLVDPDNRQPVDYDLRKQLLAKVREMSALEAWQRRGEGLAKLWLIWKTLNLRAHRPRLFEGSQAYVPITPEGASGSHIVAFRRGDDVITVSQRLPFTVQDQRGGTSMELPAGQWYNIFSGQTFRETRVPIGRLLSSFPVALLTRKEVLS